jgi:hypothetical protein
MTTESRTRPAIAVLGGGNGAPRPRGDGGARRVSVHEDPEFAPSFAPTREGGVIELIVARFRS